MPMHKALKPFGWYPDGYTREALNVGDERDFGGATAGLVAEKMIAPVGETKPVEVVAEPAVEQDAEPDAELAIEPAVESEQEPGDAHFKDEQPKQRRGRKANK